ncbi:hypothetical protein [Rhizobium leguminosarum]|uniref:Uncharacterized protein n=1 Tax=Rhizobium leguminosarum TaxID=384 RepID=A0A1B1CI20_RHILE|nr:hypothetical protein [Rhizobium leguminosarum]ANP89309.1 hypothetical protein BA011_26430 [Rhizobium leguminosarum]
MVEWQISFTSEARLIFVASDAVPLIVKRSADKIRTRHLSPKEYAIYQAIAHPIHAGRVAEKCGIELEEVEVILHTFATERFAIFMDGLWLGLAQEAGLNPWTDSDLATEQTLEHVVSLATTE